MLNKRSLIRNILSNHDEGTFWERKECIDIFSASGKAKLLKHICALGNSNPHNESFLIVGVTDDNGIVGTDYLDDSIFQNLVSAYLYPAPEIKYENIVFPSTEEKRPVGLLTISANGKRTSFAKSIDRIAGGASFHRIGSKSEPVASEIAIYPSNKLTVEELLRKSRITIKDIVDGVVEFFKVWSPDYHPSHVVFKEEFVVCWSGWRGTSFYSEVDIQIINEGVRLFFSANQDVQIKIADEQFFVLEHVFLGYDSKSIYIPFESTAINFNENGTYSIEKENVFIPPIFPESEIQDLYKRCKQEEKEIFDSRVEGKDLKITEEISMCFFICYMNGIELAKDDFYRSREYVDGASGEWYSKCERILNAYEARIEKITRTSEA